MIVYTHTKKIKVPLFLFLLTFIIAGYFSSIGVDPHHDGVMFKPALDVARGAMLFRDTFTQYGALTTLLQAWAIMVFGKYLLTIQLLTAFVYGLIASLLYIIFRRIVPKLLSVITVLVWIFTAPYFLALFLPWASVYALFFQLLGTYFLIKNEESSNALYLFGAGAATAAVFFTRQPGGVFMLAGVYAYLLVMFITRIYSFKKFIRALYLYTCGVILITAGFLIWIAGNGAFTDFWKQSILFAYNFGANRPEANFNGIITRIFPGGGNPVSLWAMLPSVSILLGIIFFIRLLIRRNIQQAKTVLIIAAIGLSAWPQYYPVTDERHVYWGGTGMFGLLTFFFFIISGFIASFIPKFRRILVPLLTCAMLAYFFVPLIYLRVIDGTDKLQAPYVTVSTPAILRGMLIPAGEAQLYQSVAGSMDRYFQNNPHGNVINLSRDGLYAAFDSRIRNISPLYLNWWEFYVLYPDYFPRMMAYIQTDKPLVISTGPAFIVPDGYCSLTRSVIIANIGLSIPCK